MTKISIASVFVFDDVANNSEIVLKRVLPHTNGHDEKSAVNSFSFINIKKS